MVAHYKYKIWLLKCFRTWRRNRRIQIKKDNKIKEIEGSIENIKMELDNKSTNIQSLEKELKSSSDEEFLL